MSSLSLNRNEPKARDRPDVYDEARVHSGVCVYQGDPSDLYHSHSSKRVLSVSLRHKFRTEEYLKLVEESRGRSDEMEGARGRARTVGTIDNVLPSYLLDYFLTVHRVLHNHVQIGSTDRSALEKLFRHDVIVLEVSSYLSSDMEYLLLIYKYLSRCGVKLPSLFVTINYTTRHFDFIASNLLECETIVGNGATGVTSRSARPDETPMAEIAQFNLFSAFPSGFKNLMVVVISTCRLYENEIFGSDQVKDRSYRLYENHDSFVEDSSRKDYDPTGDRIMLFQTVEEFLDVIDSAPSTTSSAALGITLGAASSATRGDMDRQSFRPTAIIIDSRVRVPVDTMYTGNVLMYAQPNDDYIHTCQSRVRARFPGVTVLTYTREKALKVVRGVFEISPSNDIVKFARSFLSLELLYDNYYKKADARLFTSAIHIESSIVAKLGLTTEAIELCVRFRLHPLIASIVERWFEKFKENKQVLFSILVFVAVMMNAGSEKTTEITEHGSREYESDVSQTSRYGQLLSRFITLCRETKDPYPEAGKETSKLLLKLARFKKLAGEFEFLTEVNAFSEQLKTLIKTYYSDYLLHRVEQTRYRSKFNSQMRWTVTTTQPPEYILPLSVNFVGNNRYVNLFVPIDRL